MHHLLTHTAGLHTGTEDAPGFAGALHLLRTHPATAAPGERYHYSNDGYKIVGAVLEAVTVSRSMSCSGTGSSSRSA